MRIAFFTPTLNLGGYEKVVINYANTFSSEHEIIVLCGKAEGSLKGRIASNVTIVNFQVRARGVLPALTRWLKFNTIDILYVPFTMYTCMAVIAKRLSGSSVIIYGSQHGFETRGSRSVERLLGRMVGKADVLTAVSATVASYDAKHLNIDPTRYYILDNPVLESERATQINHKSSDIPTFVTAGRLAPDKHLEIPIQIIHEVLKTVPVKLILLGDGPERENLEKLVNELGASSAVTFLGFVEDPTEYICGCEALFQTSEIESFGNSVVEALSCGVPVIATECGGPIEIIEGDKYGINIGSYNSENVIQKGVDAVMTVLQKPFDAEKMQMKAKKYIAANLLEQFLEPYYECVKQN